MTGQRDPERERRFLKAAAPLTLGWIAHARGRLAAGELEYGGSWATRGVDELLREAAEEGADVGAWVALAEQALDQRVDLKPAEREAITKAMFEAARYGGWAWARIAGARALLAKADGRTS